VNAADEGNTEEPTEKAFGQHSHGLKGMSHDEGRLGVVLGLLVESLHGWHFLSFLRNLQPVGNEKQVALPGDGGEELQGEQAPQLGEFVEFQGTGVEEV